MALKAEFNSSYTATKVNDTVLSIAYSSSPNGGSYKNVLLYDFTARVMIMRTDGHGDSGAVVTPFSQLDYESLATMREKLISLRGRPPELPSDKRRPLPARSTP